MLIGPPFADNPGNARFSRSSVICLLDRHTVSLLGSMTRSHKIPDRPDFLQSTYPLGHRTRLDTDSLGYVVVLPFVERERLAPRKRLDVNSRVPLDSLERADLRRDLLLVVLEESLRTLNTEYLHGLAAQSSVVKVLGTDVLMPRLMGNETPNGHTH